VFSSRCEQTVCSCAVTCSQGSGGTAPYTISPLEGGRRSSPRPGRLSPAKKTQYSSGRSGWMRKISPPPGSNPAPPAVQSRSTNVPSNGNMSEVKWLVMGLSPRKTCFDPRSVHTGFVADKVALAQVYLRLLRLHTLRIIPSVLHTHLHHDNDLTGRTKQ